MINVELRGDLPDGRQATAREKVAFLRNEAMPYLKAWRICETRLSNRREVVTAIDRRVSEIRESVRQYCEGDDLDVEFARHIDP